jgi:DNA-binding XRE family transcriptional regulator
VVYQGYRRDLRYVKRNAPLSIHALHARGSPGSSSRVAPELGLTQEQLAERMGTSHSAISRVESGQHRASVATLERLAQALEVRFVMGFETGSREAPVRELVSL